MSYMEIASYLGLISIAMADTKDRTAEIEKGLEAVRTAQLIIYKLALKELADEIADEG